MGRNDLYPYVKNHYGHVLSRVRLFVTPWTVACQAPLSKDSPGKNPGVGYHASSRGIFLTQGSNPHLLCLLHCRQVLYHKRPLGSPLWAQSLFNCVCVCDHKNQRVIAPDNP